MRISTYRPWHVISTRSEVEIEEEKYGVFSKKCHTCADHIFSSSRIPATIPFCVGRNLEIQN